VKVASFCSPCWTRRGRKETREKAVDGTSDIRPTWAKLGCVEQLN
jgi:hypothetical protein